LPEVLLAAGEDTPARRLAARVRQALAAAGLAEMVTLAFTDTETNRRLPGFVGRALAPLAVKNPLSSEAGELRRSPLAGLLRALRLNLALGATVVGAFELGKGYGLDAHDTRQEPHAVALLLAGAWPAWWLTIPLGPVTSSRRSVRCRTRRSSWYACSTDTAGHRSRLGRRALATRSPIAPLTGR